ncbi:MAG TPA: ferrous iron transport protein B [Candidatus Polarisedimenticolia bacterium]|nr:ferrous iron transport protein B [Candidatus Polarisedimenticolia bacterium]
MSSAARAADCAACAGSCQRTAAAGLVPEKVALVGNPNVGKSVLFGLLTGRYVTVSNYPGTTVEISRGAMILEGRAVPVVDTPGTNGLTPQSEDERVTRDLLLERPCTVLQVADAKNLPRALALTLQLAEAGLACVLCLNMSDEAESLGVSIDVELLSGLAGVPVASTVATRREGVARLRAALRHARVPALHADYGRPIEEAVSQMVPLLPPGPVAARALALAVLSRDITLGPWLRDRMRPQDLARAEEVAAGLARSLREPAALAIQRRRLEAAGELAARVVREGRGALREQASLDALTTHPLWGYPIAAGVLYALYLFVGVLGAQTAVGWIEEGLFGRVLNPAVEAAVRAWSAWDLPADLIAGPYGLFTMGLTYALAIVLPIVVTFFFAFSVLEDSGYLPRLAVMLNRLFWVMGLNGRAVLPMVLGLGCDTMATLTTRILGSRKERRIVILLLALGVPCSAQLGVILGMLAALSWKAAVVWASAVAGSVVLVGWLAARILPGEREEFVMEIPPLRRPCLANLLRKTAARVGWYLKEAVPLFLLGTLLLFAADRSGLLGRLQRALQPVVTSLLGLPAQSSEAFLMGFLRRDFGAAGLFRLAGQGSLDPVQAVVSLVVMTLFIPCVANLLMIVKEQGARAALAVAAFVFPFAVLVGTALNHALRAAGASL